MPIEDLFDAATAPPDTASPESKLVSVRGLKQYFPALQPYPDEDAARYLEDALKNGSEAVRKDVIRVIHERVPRYKGYRPEDVESEIYSTFGITPIRKAPLPPAPPSAPAGITYPKQIDKLTADYYAGNNDRYAKGLATIMSGPSNVVQSELQPAPAVAPPPKIKVPVTPTGQIDSVALKDAQQMAKGIQNSAAALEQQRISKGLSDIARITQQKQAQATETFVRQQEQQTEQPFDALARMTPGAVDVVKQDVVARKADAQAQYEQKVRTWAAGMEAKLLAEMQSLPNPQVIAAPGLDMPVEHDVDAATSLRRKRLDEALRQVRAIRDYPNKGDSGWKALARGLYQGIGRTDEFLANIIAPGSGELPAMMREVDQQDIARRAREGEQIKPEEEALLMAPNALGSLGAGGKGLSQIAYDIGQATSQMVPYSQRFGFWNRAIWKPALEEAATTSIKTALKEGVKAMGKGAVIGLADVPGWSRRAIERMAPDIQLAESPAGQLILGKISESKSSVGEALLRGIAGNVVEMGSENFGSLLEGLKMASIGKYMRRHGIPAGGVERAAAQLAKEIGWDGPIFEWAEEEVGEPLQAWLEKRDYVDPVSTGQGRERTLTTLGSIMLFGAPFSAAQHLPGSKKMQAPKTGTETLPEVKDRYGLLRDIYNTPGTVKGGSNAERIRSDAGQVSVPGDVGGRGAEQGGGDLQQPQEAGTVTSDGIPQGTGEEGPNVTPELQAEPGVVPTFAPEALSNTEAEQPQPIAAQEVAPVTEPVIPADKTTPESVPAPPAPEIVSSNAAGTVKKGETPPVGAWVSIEGVDSGNPVQIVKTDDRSALKYLLPETPYRKAQPGYIGIKAFEGRRWAESAPDAGAYTFPAEEKNAPQATPETAKPATQPSGAEARAGSAVAQPTQTERSGEATAEPAQSTSEQSALFTAEQGIGGRIQPNHWVSIEGINDGKPVRIVWNTDMFVRIQPPGRKGMQEISTDRWNKLRWVSREKGETTPYDFSPPAPTAKPSAEPTAEPAPSETHTVKEGLFSGQDVTTKPSQAQIDAGNYTKPHAKWQGLPLVLETGKGQTRSGVDEDGNQWSNTLVHDYGYIQRTEGNDQDHVDVFMGPNPESEKVYILNQKKGDGFDEHKVLAGFTSRKEAERGYLSNYDKNWIKKQGSLDIQETDVAGLKDWLKTGDMTQPAKITRSYNPNYAAAKKIEGAADRQTLPTGEEITGRYKIVSADDVLASHNEKTFSQTEGYPVTDTGETPNDRNYQRDKNAQAEVLRIAKNLDARAVENAPRVTREGIVVDGNNRTMSRKLAAEQGTDATYRAALKTRADRYGFKMDDVDKVKNPMLVFEIDGEPDYSTRAYARYNVPETKEKSALDRVIEIIRTIPQDTADRVARTVAQHETMSEFYSAPESVKRVRTDLEAAGVYAPQERNRFVSSDGKFSPDGQTLVESVVLSHHISEESVRKLDAEGVRSFRRVLARNVVRLAETASYGADYSLSTPLNSAIAVQYEMSSRGLTIEEYVSQGDMFSTTTISPEARLIHRTLAKGERAFATFLDRYNRDAQAAFSGQEVMFDANQPTNTAQIIAQLENLARKSGYEEANTPEPVAASGAPGAGRETDRERPAEAPSVQPSKEAQQAPVEVDKNGRFAMQKWAKNEAVMVDLLNGTNKRTQEYMRYFRLYYNAGRTGTRLQDIPLSQQRAVDMDIPGFLGETFWRAGVDDAHAAEKKAEKKATKQTTAQTLANTEPGRTYLDVPYNDREIAKRHGGKFDYDYGKWYVNGPVPSALAKYPTVDVSTLEKKAPRIYLNVPKADKDFAKSKGAKWDMKMHKWYVTKAIPPALAKYAENAAPSVDRSQEAADLKNQEALDVARTQFEIWDSKRINLKGSKYQNFTPSEKRKAVISHGDWMEDAYKQIQQAPWKWDINAQIGDNEIFMRWMVSNGYLDTFKDGDKLLVAISGAPDPHIEAKTTEPAQDIKTGDRITDGERYGYAGETSGIPGMSVRVDGTGHLLSAKGWEKVPVPRQGNRVYIDAPAAIQTMVRDTFGGVYDPSWEKWSVDKRELPAKYEKYIVSFDTVPEHSIIKETEKPPEPEIPVNMGVIDSEVYDVTAVRVPGTGFLAAPNGKKSNLPPHLWKMVRTDEFKRWYGDWEKGQGSAWLDQNGEPRMFYHGSAVSDIRAFDLNLRGNGADEEGGFGDWGNGMYFTPRTDDAKGYAVSQADRLETDTPTVYTVFLNQKHPFDMREDNPKNVQNTDPDAYDDVMSYLQDNWGDFDIGNILASHGYDGLANEQFTEVVAFKPEDMLIVAERSLSPAEADDAREWLKKNENAEGPSTAVDEEQEAPNPRTVRTLTTGDVVQRPQWDGTMRIATVIQPEKDGKVRVDEGHENGGGGFQYWDVTGSVSLVNEKPAAPAAEQPVAGPLIEQQPSGNSARIDDVRQRREDLMKKFLAAANTKTASALIPIDPDAMSLATQIAFTYVEEGLLRFEDFARDMLRMAGEVSRPYLQGAYLAARMSAGKDVRSQMDSSQFVEDYDIDSLEVANEPTAQEDAQGVEQAGPESGTGNAEERDTPSGTEISSEPGGGGNRTTSEAGTESDGYTPRREDESPVPTARENTGDFFHTNPGDLVATGSKKKFHQNMAAVRLIADLESEGRMPTDEERHTLSLYSGWGQFPQVFDETKADWFTERESLKKLLNTRDYAEARASTKNAHFTDPSVVLSMYEGLARMGFQGGSILEPAVGSGNFFSLMPRDMWSHSRTTAIEIDPLTSKIAGYLFPTSKVLNMPFQDFAMPDNTYDLAISNVPFMKGAVLSDRRYRLLKASLHDYFFVKMLDKVRPGGYVMAITSRYTLDKVNSRIREQIASQADLVRAIRLPGDAFKSVAGTSVVTDILVFRKRTEGEEPGSTAWIGTTNLPDASDPENTIPTNAYFKEHPEDILGSWETTGSMRRENEPTVRSTGDWRALLSERMRSLPENQYKPATSDFANPITLAENMQGEREGKILIRDGKVYSVQSGQAVEMVYPVSDIPKLIGMDGVRTSLVNLYALELSGADEAQATEARKNLNTLYDAFVAENGAISKKENVALFLDDPDLPLLLSLEHYNKKTEKFTKADVFFKNTVTPFIARDHAENTQDAVAVSLMETGRLDVNRIAQLLGSSTDDVEKAFVAEDLAYLDPQAGWVYRDYYLSGNVKSKLAAAEQMTQLHPEYQRNVDALKKVQPADIPAEKINAPLGAPWIPASDVRAFVASVLGISDPDDVKISSNPQTGKWFVLTSDAVKARAGSEASTVEYGTPFVPFINLVAHALNGSYPLVQTKGSDGEMQVNQDETANAKAMLNEVKNFFQEWVWEDPERNTRLHRTYNDIYNTDVKTVYSADHYKDATGRYAFPGLAPHFNAREFQAAGVVRIIMDGRAMLAHEVGTGKTATMLISAMEMKRMGMVKKPMLTTKNSAFSSFVAQARELYPSARILVLEDLDTPEKRKVGMSRIASGDWDMIISTHEQLKFLPVKPATERAFIEEEIRLYRQAWMEAAMAEGSLNPEGEYNDMMQYESGYRTKTKKRQKSSNVKDIETKISNLTERLRSLTDFKRDDAIFWEDSGIDFIMVDEAHAFKNLGIATSMHQMKGVPTGNESQRATDLLMKVRWLQERQAGRGVVFSTGTPITNSIGELYNMQRFLHLDELRDRGIEAFDNWVKVFAEPEVKLELDARQAVTKVTRLSKFVNIPELQRLAGKVFDVVFSNQVPGLVLPKRNDIVVETKLTRMMKKYVEWIQYRVMNMPTDKRVDNMLLVSSDARKLSVDARLVIPSETYSETPSKADEVVSNVMSDLKKKPGGVQLIFLPLGQGQMKGTDFILGPYLVDRLVKAGIPRDKIINFSDNMNAVARMDAARRLYDGEALIGIGSTDTIGTGANVQRNLMSLHFFGPGWRPADIVQCEGRAIRQGNQNEEVKIYRYITLGSFDSFMWNLLDTKWRYIVSFLKGEDVGREIRDDDTEELDYATVAAIASGDPRILTVMKLRDKIDSLERERRRVNRNVNRMADTVERLEENRTALERTSEIANALVIPPMSKTPAVTIYVGSWYEPKKTTMEETNPEDIATLFQDQVNKVRKTYLYDTVRKSQLIGQYRGFDVYYNYVMIRRTGKDSDGNAKTGYDDLSRFELVASNTTPDEIKSLQAGVIRSVGFDDSIRIREAISPGEIWISFNAQPTPEEIKKHGSVLAAQGHTIISELNIEIGRIGRESVQKRAQDAIKRGLAGNDADMESAKKSGRSKFSKEAELAAAREEFNTLSETLEAEGKHIGSGHLDAIDFTASVESKTPPKELTFPGESAPAKKRGRPKKEEGKVSTSMPTVESAPIEIVAEAGFMPSFLSGNSSPAAAAIRSAPKPSVPVYQQIVNAARMVRKGLTLLLAPKTVSDRLILGTDVAKAYHEEIAQINFMGVHGALDLQNDELNRLLKLSQSSDLPPQKRDAFVQWWNTTGRRMKPQKAIAKLQDMHDEALSQVGWLASWMHMEPSGQMVFGGRQRWGILSRSMVKQMEQSGQVVYEGLVLPDGRTVGETESDGSAQLYLEVPETEVRKAYDDFQTLHPEALPYLHEYVKAESNLREIQVLGKKIPLIPFSRSEMEEYLKDRDPDFEGIDNYVHSIGEKRKTALSMLGGLLRKRTPDMLKRNRGILSSTGVRDWNISRATMQGRLNFLTSELKSEQAGVLLSLAAKPLSGQPDPGYIPLNLSGYDWRQVRAMFNRTRLFWQEKGVDVNAVLTGTYQLQSHWQIPQALSDELVGMFKPQTDLFTDPDAQALVSGAGKLFNMVINSINATHLVRPGTAATNYFSGEIQLFQKTLADMFYYALSGGSVRAGVEMKNNFSALVRRLSPSARREWDKIIPNQVFERNFYQDLGNTHGDEGVTNKLLIPFQAVEVLFKARVWDMTIHADAEMKARQDPSWNTMTTKERVKLILKHASNPTPEMLSRARELSDRFTYDYGNIPRWLSKLKKSVVFRSILPYPTYVYKFGSQMVRGLGDVSGFVPNTLRGKEGTVRSELGLGKMKSEWTPDSKVLKAMAQVGYTPDHLRKIAHFLATGGMILGARMLVAGGDDKKRLGQLMDPEGNLYSDYFADSKFDVSNRFYIKETDDALYYLRAIKYPFVREGMALEQMNQGQFDWGTYFGDLISTGSVFDVLMQGAGMSDKYNSFKPFGAKLGETVGSDIPLAPILNDFALFVDPIVRKSFDEEKGFFTNAWMGFSSKMPGLSTLLEPKLDPQTGEARKGEQWMTSWNFLTGLRLKSVNKNEKQVRDLFGRFIMDTPGVAKPDREGWFKLLSETEQERMRSEWKDIRPDIVKAYAEVQKVRYQTLVSVIEQAKAKGYTEDQIAQIRKEARDYANSAAKETKAAIVGQALAQRGYQFQEAE